MEWTNEMCIKVMNAYLRYWVLWNPESRLYLPRIMKNETLDNVCKTSRTEIDSNEFKNIMLNLFGPFIREKAKANMGTDTGWYYYYY